MNKQIDCEIHGLSDVVCTDYLLIRYKCINCLEDQLEEKEEKQ